MIVGYVEPSGEHRDLAWREVEAAVEALGGRLADVDAPLLPGLVPVHVADEATLVRLAARLALARRTMVAVGGAGSVEEAARVEGASRRSASFRRLGRPGGTADAEVRAAGAAYVLGGGSVDLETPDTRYWIALGAATEGRLLREVASVDRAKVALRAMPRLPFRRPVSLPPRLARAAANLAGVCAGERVLDPFLGTGALLAEAALLGARVYGIDADPAMVRGALRNFAHLGVRAEAFVAGDAREVELDPEGEPFDAVLTDPPYGRSSASVGAEPAHLVPEVLSRWQARVREGGRIVVLSPGGGPCVGPPWVEACRVPVRVHRSLTREFRCYRRPG